MAIDIQELLSLPATEKLRLINLLWDNMHESEVSAQISKAEWDEIFRREEHMKAHPEEWLTEEQMWNQLDELQQK